MKPILVSGIQPTGKLHLGNYLGALKNFVELQNSNKYSSYFFIADYHSLTETFDQKEKSGQILDIMINFLAAGLDPKKSVIFLQSAIPAHAELCWILNTITPFGELRRMTQFKDKTQVIFEYLDIKHKNERGYSDEVSDELAIELATNVGLFDYPVLMAADILLYDAAFVPVGEDQLQHLELTRTLARKFNSKFSKTFIEPKPLLTEVPRLMSLDDPTKKMSKSRPQGCLFLDNSPTEIKAKIQNATTDSGKEIKYDETHKPGISNLLLIYSSLNNESIKSIEKKFIGKGYGDFKKSLAEVIIKALEPFQKNKKELSKNLNSVKKIIEIGNKKALEITGKKIIQIKEKIGLIW
ncbi:MAG: tryptophan--tRNA ligase [Patescibacteria group bacterium]|nr:tryptophan--tRNA ligase [Patescibacteria group bacterium]